MNARLAAALKKYGIDRLNELQRKAYSEIKEGKNCLIIAPTGSGKTEAAIIPLIEKILENDYPGIALLYITPLRALNRDMLRRIEQIANELEISIAVRHGDTGEGERRRQSLRPPQILITTPETFQLLFLGRTMRNALKNVKFVVVDEVHEFAESERGVQLSVAVERLREYADFQIVALSATVGDDERIMRFIGCDTPVNHQGEKRYHYRIIKPSENDYSRELSLKLRIDPSLAAELLKIKEISENHRSTLIFVNTRQTAEALALRLKRIMNAEVHHGSLSKDVRIENERKFMNGEIKALICTSSLELGVDIGHVDCVIQYNSPREVKRLIQRVGRSGHRIDMISRGYIIAGSFDEILESAVIVKRAGYKLIEETVIHESSLDTLANQISALALEYGRINLNDAFRIIKRAYPFRGLDYDFMIEFCNYLSGLRVIDFDGYEIRARRKTRRYFYENISMIPDEKHYPVRDITTGKIIGALDESFLQTFSGELFSMRGEVWRILSVDSYVRVAPAESDADVPSWAGEEIPVPFEVAQDVGKLRRIISDFIRNGKDDEAVGYLMKSYDMDRNAAMEVVELIKEQIEKGYDVPDDRRIVIEGNDDAVIINACFGHKTNEGLGRVIALLVSAKRGRNAGVEIDPYRIKITPANVDEVKEIFLSLKGIDADGLQSLLERAVVDTKLFQWKMLNVARKTGYLSKDVEMSRVNVRRLIRKLYDTPIFREAMREILFEKIDARKILEILSKLNEFEMVTYSAFTPVGLSSSRQSFDILLSSRPIEAIIDTLKQRIEQENCHFYCLNCSYHITLKVGMIDRLDCPRCNSKLVAVFSARRKMDDVSKNELYRIANLVMVHGKRAVYALNTYGIGPDTAGKILRNYHPDERSFLKALLEAEKNYIRSRVFWD